MQALRSLMFIKYFLGTYWPSVRWEMMTGCWLVSLIRDEKLTLIWYQLQCLSLWLRSAGGVICVVGLPSSAQVCPGLPVPRQHCQSGNKEVDWEPLSVLFTNRNIPLSYSANCGESAISTTNFHLSVDMAPDHLTSPSILLGVDISSSGPRWSWGRAEHHIANKSINQPKSGKVCLVMSSDWSHGSPPQWTLRNKSNENWKTADIRRYLCRYQSQLQYLIFDWLWSNW